MHDVGAAEALGVLEGSGVEDVAGLEVDEVHGDGCGADVGGDAEDASAVAVDDAGSVVCIPRSHRSACSRPLTLREGG